VQRVEPMEELEVDTRWRSTWYTGAMITSPMPAVIFQKIAPLY